MDNASRRTIDTVNSWIYSSGCWYYSVSLLALCVFGSALCVCVARSFWQRNKNGNGRMSLIAKRLNEKWQRRKLPKLFCPFVAYIIERTRHPHHCSAYVPSHSVNIFPLYSRFSLLFLCCPVPTPPILLLLKSLYPRLPSPSPLYITVSPVSARFISFGKKRSSATSWLNYIVRTRYENACMLFHVRCSIFCLRIWLECRFLLFCTICAFNLTSVWFYVVLFHVHITTTIEIICVYCSVGFSFGVFSFY